MANDSIIIKKKKVVGHGGHHGGSWKVAYADFVTAMMAFFMVLWIMGMSDQAKVNISGYFNDPAGFMKSNPASRNIIVPISGTSDSRTSSMSKAVNDKEDYRGYKLSQANEELTVKAAVEKSVEGIPDLKKLLKHIEIKVGKEGLRIELLEDKRSIFFESGSAVIRPEGRQIVKKLTPVLIKINRNMVIEGHTDRKPYAGTVYTNWELSGQRAIAMRQFLAQAGVPVNRFKAVSGFADSRLRIPSKPFDPSNRRVTILLPWVDPNAKVVPEAVPPEKKSVDLTPKQINIHEN